MNSSEKSKRAKRLRIKFPEMTLQEIADKIGIALEDQSTTGNTFDFVALKM